MRNAVVMTASTGAAIIPANDLRPVLFDDFVRFIDRTEKTTRTYLTNLKQFIAWLKYEAIVRPLRKDIIAYRDFLSAEHPAIKLDQEAPQGWTYRTDSTGSKYTIKCRPSTVSQYLRSVAQFFKWTAANGLYPDIAAGIHGPKINRDTHRKEALQPADVLKIENTISLQAQEKAATAAEAAKDTAGRFQRATEQGKRLYAMYLLAVTAGLRTVEISRANIKDLETINNISVLYVTGKGHTEADTKKILAPEVRAAIDDYLQFRTDRKIGTAPLFVSTGNRSGGKRIAPETISKMLKQAMKEAGFNSERITAHSLRHTAGTNVQEITGNIYLTQKYMRHSNPATTEIYLHCNTEKQENEIAQQLYNRYHGIEGAQDHRQQLERLLQTMTPAQIEQLTGIAAAITR